MAGMRGGRRSAALLLAAALLAAPARADRLKAATAETGGERRDFGEPISLSLRDADLVETLRTFARLGGFNLVLQPGISGTVTVELENVPWDQALEQILKVHGLGMEVTRGRLVVGPREAMEERRRRLESVRTVRLELRYADAAAVARALSRPAAGILTPRGAIRADAESGALVLRDTGARLLELGRLLAEIDVPAAAGEDPAAFERRCLEAWRKLAPEPPPTAD